MFKMLKNVHWSLCKVPLFLSDFKEIWNFLIEFPKYSNIKLHENPASESQVVPCARAGGRTDRQDEANSSFPHFCQSALKLDF
jgi:hypothetical protein